MSDLTFRNLHRNQQPNKYVKQGYTLYRSMMNDPEFKYGLRAWVLFPDGSEASLYRLEDGSLMQSKGAFKDGEMFTGLNPWLQDIELYLKQNAVEELSHAE